MSIQLNSKGEVADFLDTSQFLASRSAFECVAYSSSLCRYAGPPGHGPSGTVSQVIAMAQFYYGALAGSNLSNNHNGMSLEQEYEMLKDIGLSYDTIDILGNTPQDIANIKAMLSRGYPILVCGAETGFYDMDLGDKVPYQWTPTGNHCVVASGIAPDGNLLVHDCANLDGNGNVRPGPRRYDTSKMHLISATAVHMPWLDQWLNEQKEEDVVIDIHNPVIAEFFTEQSDGTWQRKTPVNGKYPIIKGAILEFYKRYGNSAYCGLTHLGLPLTSEQPLDPQFSHCVRQYFERGTLCFDQKHIIADPPGAGDVYVLGLYGADKGLGEDPAVKQLQAQIASLQKQLADNTPQPDPKVAEYAGKLEQIAPLAGQIVTLAKVG